MGSPYKTQVTKGSAHTWLWSASESLSLYLAWLSLQISPRYLCPITLGFILQWGSLEIEPQSLCPSVTTAAVPCPRSLLARDFYSPGPPFSLLWSLSLMLGANARPATTADLLLRYKMTKNWKLWCGQVKSVIILFSSPSQFQSATQSSHSISSSSLPMIGPNGGVLDGTDRSTNKFLFVFWFEVAILFFFFPTLQVCLLRYPPHYLLSRMWMAPWL